jgi:hypothetical protein
MDEQLPSVFIGPPTEGLNVAREVELQLQQAAVLITPAQAIRYPHQSKAHGELVLDRCPPVIWSKMVRYGRPESASRVRFPS